MKKITSILLIVLILFSFSSCINLNFNPDTEDNTEQIKEITQEKDIDYYRIDDFNYVDKDNKYIRLVKYNGSDCKTNEETGSYILKTYKIVNGPDVIDKDFTEVSAFTLIKAKLCITDTLGWHNETTIKEWSVVDRETLEEIDNPTAETLNELYIPSTTKKLSQSNINISTLKTNTLYTIKNPAQSIYLKNNTKKNYVIYYKLANENYKCAVAPKLYGKYSNNISIYTKSSASMQLIIKEIEDENILHYIEDVSTIYLASNIDNKSDLDIANYKYLYNNTGRKITIEDKKTKKSKLSISMDKGDVVVMPVDYKNLTIKYNSK